MLTLYSLQRSLGVCRSEIHFHSRVFYNNVAPSSRRGEWRMRGNICHMRVFAKCFPLVYAGGLLYFSVLETNKGAIKHQTV